MGVIGRLDDQVNEIIIKPIGAGTAEATETEAGQRPSQNTSQQPAATKERAEDEENHEPRSEELPVWLL